MSIVPRYEFIVSDTPPLGQVVPVDNGELCKYADHVVAVAAVREDERGKVLLEARDYLLTHNRSETLTWIEDVLAAIGAEIATRPVSMTQEEKIAFSRKWDAQYESGRKRDE